MRGSSTLRRLASSNSAEPPSLVAPSDQEQRIADRLKNLQKFEVLFFTEEQRAPVALRLAAPD